MMDLVTRHEDLGAVKGVHFYIKEGKFCGLLKPNGAGKTTTTVSMLSTITKQKRDSRVDMRGSPVRLKHHQTTAMELQQTMETCTGKKSSGRSVNERDRSILAKDRRKCERVT